MNRHFRLTVVSLVTFALVGCAVTPAQFSLQKGSLSVTDVCRAHLSAQKSGDAYYLSSTEDELGRRNVAKSECAGLVSKANDTAAGAALAVALIVGIAALASRGGGGGSSYQPSNSTDYSWEWDEFYNDYRQLVWACRGVQTGQFADAHRCQYKFKSDSKWPSKQALR